MEDKPTLLRRADYVLRKCGRVVAPPGSAYVDLPASYLLQSVIAANGAPQTEPRVIDSDTSFILRAISGFNNTVSLSWPNYSYRIKFPDGSFYNGTWASSVGDWAFARGSYRLTLDGEVICPPGSEILVDFNPGVAPTSQGNPQLLFEGVLRYVVKGGSRAPFAPPYLRDRHVRSPNQNIMAPEFMTGSCADETPIGFEDEYFAYVMPSEQAVSVPITAGAATPQLSIELRIPGGTRAFVWRETRFVITAAGAQAPPTGVPVVKFTMPDGWALTEDWVQCAEMAGPMPRDIIVPEGRSILMDATVFDAAGTGSFSIQPYLKGAKRRRIAA